jgi:hypothetical protein
MSAEPEAIRVVEYFGDEDLSVWLEELNDGHDPVIFPLWPEHYPEYLAVYLTSDQKLGVALSRDAMLAARAPDCLWFCEIPRSAFVALTSTESSWFGENDVPSSSGDPGENGSS